MRVIEWQTPCSAEVQTCPFPPFPPQAEAQGPSMIHVFPDQQERKWVQRVTLLSDKENLFRALLLVAKSKIQKLPSRQARSENQWLSVQQAFKYNACVKPSKTELILCFYIKSSTIVWVLNIHLFILQNNSQVTAYSAESYWPTMENSCKSCSTLWMNLCRYKVVHFQEEETRFLCLIIPVSSTQITTTISPQNAVHETHPL